MPSKAKPPSPSLRRAGCVELLGRLRLAVARLDVVVHGVATARDPCRLTVRGQVGFDDVAILVLVVGLAILLIDADRLPVAGIRAARDAGLDECMVVSDQNHVSFVV